MKNLTLEMINNEPGGPRSLIDSRKMQSRSVIAIRKLRSGLLNAFAHPGDMKKAQSTY